MDFLNNQIKFAKDRARNLRNTIASINYQKLQFDTIFCINSNIEKIHAYGTMIYEKYDFIARIVDLSQYAFIYLIAIIQYRRTEPLTNTWSCVSVLTKSYYNYKNFNYSYVEVYEPKLNMILEKLSTNFSALYYDVHSIISKENSICDSLITCKYNDKYIHRVVDRDNKTFTSKNSKIVLDESDIKFLSIEYRSKDYIIPLVLELKNGDYLVNNEILSATFIKRLLEYQISYHAFDKNYEITILDNNLKAVYLKFGEYIKLNKTDYSVLKTSEFHESVCTDYAKNEEILKE
jgi:hypothetical protein